MLKKLIAMTIVTTMLLSSFCIIAQAEYGYDYQQTMYGCSRETTYSNVVKHRAYMQGSGNENAQGAYYLYNSTGRTDKYVKFNNQSGTDVMKFSDYMFDLNTTAFANQWFYSKGSANYGNWRLTNENFKSDSAKWLTADTMTFNYKIQYDTNFILTLFQITTHSALNKRNLPLFRILDDGKVYSGPLGTNTAYLCDLELGKTYDIGVVIKYVPTSTAGTYDIVKSIYVDNVLEYMTKVSQAQQSDLKFWDSHIDVYPWTTTKGADSNAIGTTYCDSNSLTADIQNSISKYTLIGTHFVLKDFHVTSGNKYAKNAPSLTNDDSDFYISSGIMSNTNFVTVAAQTAADDATANGTIVLATYNASGELESIKTSPITLTKSAITEQDIDISTANADETKLFIINSTSAMTPLAQSTVLN